jgi:deoxyribodipyrimidine photo-lyase
LDFANLCSDDVPFDDPKGLPDVFTTYRKQLEPLREKPHPVLDAPEKGSLPPFPPNAIIPEQLSPFRIPSTLEEIQEALARPLSEKPIMKNPPSYPEGAQSAHPFVGGESYAQERLEHTISSESMTSYKETRNGLIGQEFSTKI